MHPLLIRLPASVEKKKKSSSLACEPTADIFLSLLLFSHLLGLDFLA